MKIVDVRCFGVKELVSRLKKVSMLHDPGVMPYKAADIQVTEIHTTQLAPAQLYALRSEFEKVSNLRWELLKNGLDILRLAASWTIGGRLADTGAGEMIGFIEFDLELPKNGSAETDDKLQTITLLPPIVEVSEEADGSRHNIINDGLHRCYLARVSLVVPAVVRIEKVPKDLPYYAYPTPGGWSDVKMIEKLDKRTIKKHHRFPCPEYKRYYRDFNSVFTNVGGPRGTALSK